MGSRAEGEAYREPGFSDLDCCTLLTQAVPYSVILPIVAEALGSGHGRLELCVRTPPQLVAVTKFNYDLRCRSVALFLRGGDPRLEMPIFDVSDFPREDLCRPLGSAVDYYLQGLAELHRDQDLTKAAVLLEKGLRKVLLHLDLQHGTYPTSPSWRLLRLTDTFSARERQLLRGFVELRLGRPWRGGSLVQAAAALGEVLARLLLALSMERGVSVTEVGRLLGPAAQQEFGTAAVRLFLDHTPVTDRDAFQRSFGELMKDAGPFEEPVVG